MTVGSGPRIEFETRGNPPDLATKFTGGFQARSGMSYSVMHRFFRDTSTRTYFGYDIVTESGSQPDSYQIRFFELGIGILDIASGIPVEPTEWTKLPLGNIPAARAVHIGDTVPIELWSDPVSGDTLTDYIHIQPAPQLLRNIVTAPSLIRNGTFKAPERTIPTVSGTARDFKADDAELRLQQPIIKMNGVAQDSPRLPVVNGVLIWFSIAEHGRYVLSLAPRPELGFVRAGEVRGGAITFSMGKDAFTVECPTAVATGYAPYTLYVLHDADWKPTSAAQSGRVLAGSVSPAEISSLRGQ
jgi:hypothetical protein